MIYTVGHTESYEQGLREMEGHDFKKLGIFDGYVGGICFESKEAAQEYLGKKGLEDYSVYGLLCDFDNVYFNAETLNMHITDSAQIVSVDA